jgi:uncharacterized protein (DUF58 family)
MALTLQELTSRIRLIEIRSKKLSNHIFAGDYSTAFKGRGMSFSEVRDYQYGDDVRAIDWNVSARFNHPYIKVFEEEREMSMMLLIDVSASTLFGSQGKSKQDLIAELSATLAFSAAKNNDKVGAIFFGNDVVKYVPPKKGKSHILNILHTMLSIEPVQQSASNLAAALQVLNNISKQRSIAFIISDFYCGTFKEALQLVARKHDVVGIQLYDGLETTLPNVGLLQVQDLETKQYTIIDSSDAQVRASYANAHVQHTSTLATMLTNNGARHIAVNTVDDYTSQLHLFFKGKRA